jgi:hypothetical protein
MGVGVGAGPYRGAIVDVRGRRWGVVGVFRYHLLLLSAAWRAAISAKLMTCGRRRLAAP